VETKINPVYGIKIGFYCQGNNTAVSFSIYMFDKKKQLGYLKIYGPGGMVMF
jgi:hypothetical protein